MPMAPLWPPGPCWRRIRARRGCSGPSSRTRPVARRRFCASGGSTPHRPRARRGSDTSRCRAHRCPTYPPSSSRPAGDDMTSGWTGGQYSVFRVVFGAYLCVHFLSLAPWGPELFSDRGMLPDASASPLAFAFPNVLTIFDSPAFVTSLLLLRAGACVLFAVGWYDRAAAVLLWYVWACLLGRNPLILNPGIPYVGWLLLAHAILPGAPYGSVAARRRPDPGGTWRMPALLFAGAWILMAMGYTYSGVTKLVSPSWLDRTAVARVLENPLARPGPLRVAILSLPDGLLRLGTWAPLALELLLAPPALFRRLRPGILA